MGLAYIFRQDVIQILMDYFPNFYNPNLFRDFENNQRTQAEVQRRLRRNPRRIRTK